MTLNRLWMGLALVGLATTMAVATPPVARAADGVSPEQVVIRHAGAEATQRVQLGLNKSLIIDLPRPARDVLVSSPQIADAVVRTQRRSFIIGRQVGQTNIFFFDIEGRQILSIELEVVHDVETLQATIDRLTPRSSIVVDGVSDSIILSGRAANAIDADRAVRVATQFIQDTTGRRVVNMIGIEGKEQVALKVTVAEMQRTTLKQLGVNLNAVLQAGSTAFNITSFNPFTLTGIQPFSDVGFDHISENGTSCTDLINGQRCAAGVVRALERNGLIRTLAEPTLTSLSGETANFLAGGEFPVPIAGRDGEITIEFKPFGVGLAFTPIVLDGGRISLKVSTEVSELSNENAIIANNLTIPGLQVRRSESTVELPSGGSLVLAGLIHEDSRQELNGFPGIKDLPVLGALFRSREFQMSETELVVIATPYLVDPVERSRIALPDEGFAAPSDVEGTLMGRLNAVYGMRTGSRPSGAYRGDVGFIVK